MKTRIIAAVLSAVSVLSLSACGSKGFDNTHDISVITREEGSGTRGAFVELVGIEQKNSEGKKIDMTIDGANTTNNTSVMMTGVQSNLYTIGYISLGSLNDTVKAVTIDGVVATAENVKNGTYKIARPFNIATKGDISESASEFIRYILSDDGQKIIADNGYIAIESTGAYSGTQIAGKVVVAGSSSVTPVMEKLKEAYLEINSDAQIEIQQSDSTTGMSAVADGICDIGMASRALKDSETKKGLVGTTIAMDGIAVIVNSDSPIEALTTEQVRDIYTGALTKWSELAQ